jgi:5-methyltetrahydrofolate--homocysteine methyltransferase
MMGVGVDAAVSKIVSLGVDAVGFNCGTASLDGYVELAGRFVSAIKAAGKDVLILDEPNAGKPELVGDKAVYNVSPEDFAAAAEKICASGVNILGGCCGTGPEHIETTADGLRI